MSTYYADKILKEMDSRKTAFLGEVCYKYSCPGCQGTVLLFRRNPIWWYCNKCMNVGTLGDITGEIDHKCENIKARWYYFKALRSLFEEQEIPGELLQSVGLSVFEFDPVRRLMHNRLYGYVYSYQEFYHRMTEDTGFVYITPDFKLYKNIREKPGFVLPLEHKPGMVKGFSFITRTQKFSMQTPVSKEREDCLYTFLQVGNSGREYIFDDIIDDFGEICMKMMVDRDCTIAVKPCLSHERDITLQLPTLN